MSSLRLQHTYLLEDDYYTSHPEDDNFRIAYCWKHLSTCGMYFDRSGKICYMYHTTGKVPCFKRQKLNTHANPAKRRSVKLGYARVVYMNKKRVISEEVHSIMADLFLDNNDLTCTQVDHLNSEHLDNRAENLERVTPEENVRRRYYGYYTKRGLPVPEKFRSPENYQIYLQSKKSDC